MRKQKSGHIIDISSIGGLVGLPFQGFYSAAKFALEGMTEALRIELRPFGIKVALVEPGDISTSFTDRRIKTGSTGEKSVYHEYFQRTIKIVETDERSGPHPIKVARVIEKILNNPP